MVFGEGVEEEKVREPWYIAVFHLCGTSTPITVNFKLFQHDTTEHGVAMRCE